MRRSGKTTRDIDQAVQDLFNKGSVYVPTKTEINQSTESYNRKLPENSVMDTQWLLGMAQEDFFSRLVKRLSIEHNGNFEVKGRIITFKKDNTI